MKVPKISVIVAVYGVENYIEKCVRSLFEQTLDAVEYIFVNDDTPDNSIVILKSVLDEYSERKNNTHIINLETNTGVANARTVGMKLATGKYMIHCDPDDYLEDDALEVLYKEAVKTDADIVTCDYYREKEDRIEYCVQSYVQTPRECIINFYKNPFFPALWAMLIRTSIIHNYHIYPYEGINTGEDLNVIFRVFLNAKSIAYVNKAFYHYVVRKGSLTQNKDIKQLWSMNIEPNLQRISYYIDSQCAVCGGDFLPTKHYLQYSKKLMLLQCATPYYKLWFDSYKECVNSLHLFHGFSSKHKVVMILFAKHYLLLVMYYKIFRPMGLRII